MEKHFKLLPTQEVLELNKEDLKSYLDELYNEFMYLGTECNKNRSTSVAYKHRLKDVCRSMKNILDSVGEIE